MADVDNDMHKAIVTLIRKNGLHGGGEISIRIDAPKMGHRQRYYHKATKLTIGCVEEKT